MTRFVLALGAVLVLTAIAAADPVITPFTFGFEDQPLDTPMTSVTIARDGFSFTISRAAGFSFVDLSPFAAPIGVSDTWGTRTLSPFDAFSDPEPFLFTMNAIPAPFVGLMYITAEFGDFTPSDVDLGDFMGEPFIHFNDDPTRFFQGSTVASFPLPFLTDGLPSSAMFGGGSEPGFEQSLFWDNFTLAAIEELPGSVVAPSVAGSSDPTGGAGGIPSTNPNVPPVPEPATIVLFALGAGAVAFRRWRRAA